MNALLSYDHAPPPHLPFAFLLAAPIWLIAFGTGLLGWGHAGLNRWDPAVLALTHLMTIGFMGNAMLGSLIQLAAVTAAVPFAKPGRLLALVWLPWQLGCGFLVAGLASMSPVWLIPAGLMLGLAAAAFILETGYALWRSAARDATTRGLRLAVVGLAVTVILGLLLAGLLAGYWTVPFKVVLDLHVGWGSVGWSGTLLLGVAFTVVPMFQLTPAYPVRLARFSLPLLALLLVGWSALTWTEVMPLWRNWLLVGPVLLLGGTTLNLQRKSRRKPDLTRRFWLTAMGALLAAALLTGLRPWLPDSLLDQVDLLVGILWFFGGLGHAIAGMLFKIVPFLIWLHWQRLNPRRRKLPSMKDLAPDDAVTLTLWLWRAALAATLAGGFWPWGWQLAGALLMAAAGRLTWQLAGMIYKYRQFRRQLQAELDKSQAVSPHASEGAG